MCFNIEDACCFESFAFVYCDIEECYFFVTDFVGKFDCFMGLIYYVVNGVIVPFQMRKMSSINLRQMGMLGSPSCKSVVSSLPMKRLAYAGAILVPIALPCFCRKNFSLNSKTLFCRTMSISFPTI